MWKWLGGLFSLGLSAAVGVVWKKADGAVSREDFKQYIDAQQRTVDRIVEAMNEHAKQDRETMAQLFANAESDRMQNNDRFVKVMDRMHDSHVALLNQVGAAASAANAASSAAAAVLASHK